MKLDISSSIPLDRALNSASVLDSEIIILYLLLHVTKFPVVDLRSIKDLT